MTSNRSHAFTISSEDCGTVPGSRRRAPALLTLLFVASLLVGAYDLLLLGLGI